MTHWIINKIKKSWSTKHGSQRNKMRASGWNIVTLSLISKHFNMGNGTEDFRRPGLNVRRSWPSDEWPFPNHYDFWIICRGLPLSNSRQCGQVGPTTIGLAQQLRMLLIVVATMHKSYRVLRWHRHLGKFDYYYIQRFFRQEGIKRFCLVLTSICCKSAYFNCKYSFLSLQWWASSSA